MRLLDRSRPDSSSPSGVRELMVQIWYPAQSVAGYRLAPYVPAKTAGLLERYYRAPNHAIARLVTRAYAGAPVALGEHPVLIYSPGLGDMRSDDTALLENLASDGYIVVAVDHTHEAQWVQFPGGRMVPWSVPYTVSSPYGSSPAVTKRRVVDVRFVLDELTRLNQTARFRGRFNLSQIGAFGFSLGGSTAASAMQLDPRLKAGADLDGAIHEPALSGGLKQPFMMMLDPAAFRKFPPFRTFVRHLRGPHLVLELAKSKHTAFDDDVWLKQTLHTVAPRLAGTIDPGAISPDLALAAESTYLNAFFATYLSHRPSSLLAEPSPAFPVITFVR
jgi:dienelactone hydrolase